MSNRQIWRLIPLSEGGQFLSGFITVSALDGNWAAEEEVFPEIRDRLASLITKPQSGNPLNLDNSSDIILQGQGSDNLDLFGTSSDLIDASLIN